MTEFGIPDYIINTYMYAHLPSRLCGYIGDMVKERYTNILKLNIKDMIEAKKEEKI